jgi:hypothetical protein
MRRLHLALVLPLALAACGGGGSEQADTPADSVALALEQYDPALFDTITWASDSSQINRGGIVWAFSCKKCHGQLGKGDGGQVMDGDTIRPPDFTTQWRFGTDDEGLIKAIYGGSAEGMPHWGISGLTTRHRRGGDLRPAGPGRSRRKRGADADRHHAVGRLAPAGASQRAGVVPAGPAARTPAVKTAARRVDEPPERPPELRGRPGAGGRYQTSIRTLRTLLPLKSSCEL